MLEMFEGWDPRLRAVVIASLAAVGGYLVYLASFRLLAWLGTRWSVRFAWLGPTRLDRLRAPVRLLFPLFGVLVARESWSRGLTERSVAIVDDLFYVVFVIGVALFFIRFTGVVHAIVAEQFDIGVHDNLEIRKVLTQTEIARRMIVIFIWIVAMAAVLLNFQQFREVGAGLLASAGIAGIVIGIAAQKTLSTIISGLHIAITQPIRVDDVVIIDGEWGRVEEITLTYLVIRIWDLRRLVVPINYIMEKPFQNWTRSSADLLGTVTLPLDYIVPLEEIRAELRRIVEASELWDGQVCLVQMTDVNERSVELRALVSADNSQAMWDLRCEVREKLVTYIADNFPQALPVARARIESPGAEMTLRPESS